MARTKAKARRGPDGHAFRENAKKKKDAGSQSTATGRDGVSGVSWAPNGGGKGKRKRNRERDGANKGDQGNDAKRRRKGEDGDIGAEIEMAEDGPEAAASIEEHPTNVHPTHAPETSLLVPIFPGLETTHTVTTMSIISSSNINKKVSRILELLSEKPTGGGEQKCAVVMLYAKAPVVSKVVSVAEIAKRELAVEGGKWFSYCVVGEVLGERKEGDKEKGKEKSGGKRDQGKEAVAEESRDEDEGEEEEEEEEAFEVMKTPFERALEMEGKPKVRAMPVMSLYLSRARIEALRKVYGEQTNAQEVK
ncbi:hypothetical protein BKA64DRAFT_699938 [Cadophora sp. MPI-SDFR-AT-0126]|nr:hypothetical protein BKA64DRAFT_699938 [Leotiomycetes sp. MPI-SDFR-AT-0126]